MINKLFKAWDKITKEICDVLVIDWLNQTIDLDKGRIERSFDDVILMQPTGLKDKNGIEIYEGYIIYWEDLAEKSDGSLNDTVEVYWNDEFMKWCVTGIRWRDKSQIEPLYDYIDVEEIEIIGNIYENPELLEQ